MLLQNLAPAVNPPPPPDDPPGDRRRRLVAIRRTERELAAQIKAALAREAPQPLRRHRMDERVLYRRLGCLTREDVAELIRELTLPLIVDVAGPRIVLAAVMGKLGPQLVYSVVVDDLGLDQACNLLHAFELTS
jgi:hypothetical protein